MRYEVDDIVERAASHRWCFEHLMGVGGLREGGLIPMSDALVSNDLAFKC